MRGPLKYRHPHHQQLPEQGSAGVNVSQMSKSLESQSQMSKRPESRLVFAELASSGREHGVNRGNADSSNIS